MLLPGVILDVDHSRRNLCHRKIPHADAAKHIWLFLWDLALAAIAVHMIRNLQIPMRPQGSHLCAFKLPVYYALLLLFPLSPRSLRVGDGYFFPGGGSRIEWNA